MVIPPPGMGVGSDFEQPPIARSRIVPSGIDFMGYSKEVNEHCRW